jgi:hypothetical protein
VRADTLADSLLSNRVNLAEHRLIAELNFRNESQRQRTLRLFQRNIPPVDVEVACQSAELIELPGSSPASDAGPFLWGA